MTQLGGGKVTQTAGAERGRASCRRDGTSWGPARGGGRPGANTGRVIGALPAGRRGKGGGVTQTAGTIGDERRAVEAEPAVVRHEDAAGLAPTTAIMLLTRTVSLGPSLQDGGAGGGGGEVTQTAGTSVVPSRRHQQRSDTRRRQA